MSTAEEGDSQAPLALVIGLSREAVLLLFRLKHALHHFESMQDVRTLYLCKRELQEKIICVLA